MSAHQLSDWLRSCADGDGGTIAVAAAFASSSRSGAFLAEDPSVEIKMQDHPFHLRRGSAGLSRRPPSPSNAAGAGRGRGRREREKGEGGRTEGGRERRKPDGARCCWLGEWSSSGPSSNGPLY